MEVFGSVISVTPELLHDDDGVEFYPCILEATELLWGESLPRGGVESVAEHAETENSVKVYVGVVSKQFLRPELCHDEFLGMS